MKLDLQTALDKIEALERNVGITKENETPSCVGTFRLIAQEGTLKAQAAEAKSMWKKLIALEATLANIEQEKENAQPQHGKENESYTEENPPVVNIQRRLVVLEDALRTLRTTNNTANSLTDRIHALELTLSNKTRTVEDLEERLSGSDIDAVKKNCGDIQILNKRFDALVGDLTRKKREIPKGADQEVRDLMKKVGELEAAVGKKADTSTIVAHHDVSRLLGKKQAAGSSNPGIATKTPVKALSSAKTDAVEDILKALLVGLLIIAGVIALLVVLYFFAGAWLGWWSGCRAGFSGSRNDDERRGEGCLAWRGCRN
jgi:hypothetical protein